MTLFVENPIIYIGPHPVIPTLFVYIRKIPEMQMAVHRDREKSIEKAYASE